MRWRTVIIPPEPREQVIRRDLGPQANPKNLYEDWTEHEDELVWWDTYFDEDIRSDGLVSLAEWLACLTEKQRFVVNLAWGLGGRRTHSLREIADLMSVSYHAAWGLHHRAMRRLGVIS